MRFTTLTTLCGGALGLLAAGVAGAPATAGTYTVRGQVVTAEGALPGAEVRLVHPPSPRSPWPEEEAERPAVPPIRATAGADGRFELAVSLDGIRPEHGGARWLLEISAPGLARRILEIPPQGRQAWAGAVEELGGILLSPGAVVSGRVVAAGAAPADAPVAGVRVALWRSAFGTPRPWTATTAEDGAFEIAEVPPGEYLAVFRREGFALGRLDRVRVRAVAGREAGVLEHPAPASVSPAAVDLGTVALSRPLALHGTVVDPAGEPLAGVRVRFRHLLPQVDAGWLSAGEAATDAAGRFTLAGAPPDLADGLFAFDKPGYVRRQSRFDAVPGAGGLRLAAPVEMREERVLAGRVVDHRSEPIAGAHVRLAERAGSSSFRTDGDGRFRLTVAEPGAHRLSVSARGFLATEAEVEAGPAGGRPEPDRIVLQPAATTDLVLVVRDAAGEPVASAEALFHSSGEGLAPYAEQLRTDAAGRGALDRVRLGGPYSLSVRHPEHPSWWRGDLVVEAGRSLLEVDLDPAPWKLVSVRGRVTDARDEPLPGADVGLTPASSLVPEYRTRTDAAGSFELRRVKEGAYRLTAAAPGWATTALPLRVASDLAPLAVTLGAGATLEGSVRGLDPRDLEELRVYATAHGSGDWRDALVDVEGYSVEGLGTGDWQVVAEAAGNRLEAQVEIEPGQTAARLDFDFPATCRVRGRVSIDGQPLAATAVQLGSVPSGPQRQHYYEVTGGDGRFAFDRVAPGTYRLWFTGPAGSHGRQLTVEADAELLLDLETRRLRGRVVDVASGEGVGEAPVEAVPPIALSHGPRWQAVSDAAGWFEVGPLLEGPWTILVRADGYLTERLPVTVAPGDPVVVELIPSDGLRVRVETASGRLPYGVQLELRDAGGGPVARGHAHLSADGTGHWRDAPPGRYRLAAHNKVAWIRTEVEIPGPVVTLRFPAAGGLRIRVPELELESALPGRFAVPVLVEATLESPEDPAFEGLRIRRSRRPLLLALAPGLWRVEARAEDGRVWTGRGRVFDGRTSEVVVALD